MSGMHIVYLMIIFFAVFSCAMLVMRYLAPSPMQQRIRQIAGGAQAIDASDARAADVWIARLAKLSGPFAKLSIPDDDWGQSSLRIRFMNAGFRGAHAPAIYFGCKTLLAISAPVLLWSLLLISGVALSTNATMFCLLMVATVGFYLPNLVLAFKISARQAVIIEHFPDALDLMTICVEAGFSTDAAIARIAQEMAQAAPILSEEMHLVTLELRAGGSKERALRNLAMRTGVEDVDALVAMLLQAERFGTSIGVSLRVLSDSLRVKRRQRAEEAAAKVALKLLFPLIFCIFPATMLVLLGPAMLQIYRVLLPSMAG